MRGEVANQFCGVTKIRPRHV